MMNTFIEDNKERLNAFFDEIAVCISCYPFSFTLCLLRCKKKRLFLKMPRTMSLWLQ